MKLKKQQWLLQMLLQQVLVYMQLKILLFLKQCNMHVIHMI